MKQTSQISTNNKYILLAILLAQMILLWVSPEERTLGVGIKPVYLHVSLTWVGMLLYVLAALFGIGVLITGKNNLASWMNTIFTLAVVFFGVGFLISMIASVVNWGGVPFREPRVIATMNVFIVSGVIWFLSRWINIIRVNGFLILIPIAFMYWGVESSRMVLHPDNPVNSSPDGIRYTFYGMFFLAILLAGWFASFIRKS